MFKVILDAVVSVFPEVGIMAQPDFSYCVAVRYGAILQATNFFMNPSHGQLPHEVHIDMLQ